jgi:hypothetical protein
MAVDKKKTIFISGSAYEYGRLGSAGKFFIKDLSRALVKNDFNIVSGYGLGVGTHVVDGALEEIYNRKKERISDRLQVFPFSSEPQPEKVNYAYRDDMISRAGAAIFLFGNKLKDISVKEADGLLKEFEIARSHKLVLIPVGASGYASEKLWKRVIENYDDHFGTREKFDLFEQLGDPSTDPETLIDLVIRAAN